MENQRVFRQNFLKTDRPFMPAPIISVENLSKRYLVGHQEERGGGLHSYTALRDVIGRRAA